MPAELAEQFDELWQSGNTPPDVFAYLEQHDGSDVAQILGILLTDQQHRWQTDAPLKVEDYLDKLPDLASDPECKLQLAVGEFQARQDSDTAPSIAEFTSRFGDISDQLRSKLSELAESDKSDDKLKLPTTQTYISDTTVGDQQLGRYRLVRILGQGAFGRVYLGFDEELHRQVAIKVPTEARFQKPEDAEHYLEEARKVASLDHPNIVPVHDVGRTDDGSIYVVSKFIEGCTLRHRIKQDRPCHDEAARIIATVANALHQAHEKRLIHRDVKPSNILIEDKSNTPYIADFGLAIREEDYLRDSKIAGTPAYMSPEQVRGEGHRLDGRSDIFSLGVVLYELLTGKTPFRGSTANELFHQVISVGPKPPRELDESLPVELERICLKSLSKQASDRYATAMELADDLLHWNDQPAKQENRELQIVPKGLRSFDAEDADFFLDLLPGPRNRNGLPESIQFWKTRIEESDPDKTFSVGLIYGPSGCGKSSLVKAGLLPRLSTDVTAIYVEATANDTETRILRSLRKQLPELPDDLGLVEVFTFLRRIEGRKVVVVIDQFEQWLHVHRAEQETELVSALRQCDGGRLEAVVMVRDDFSMAASRFMDSLDIRIVQGENFATVDLFDVDHAKKVLIKFGQAFGKFPAQTAKLTDEQQEFASSVAAGLSEDGKVVSVRLALFAEMVKGKPWVPDTLEEVGGTEWMGVNFLEETFSSRTANPEKHRLHQQAAREVLKALLPEVGSDIKGHMRSHSELLEASGYQSRPGDFSDLLRILDGELRLITPTDPEGFQTEYGSDPGSKFYQLTHDYLVPSLRDWLTRKQQETRKGRAELKLAERSDLWNAKPENRHLPSVLEWSRIRTLTEKNKWTDPQQKMMGKAGRVHGLRSSLAVAALVAVVVGGITLRNVAQERQRDAEATQIVKGLVNAETSQIKTMIENLASYRQYAEDNLQKAFEESPVDSNAKLHAALAMLPDDKSVLPFLKDRLLTVSAAQFQSVRDLLESDKSELIDDYWKIARGSETSALRFQAACALASFEPENEHWKNTEFCKFLAEYLVDVLPSELLPWRNALRPVKDHLVQPLAAIYGDDTQGESVRDFATDTLADYLNDDADGLFSLLADSKEKQFATMFDKLIAHRQRAIALANAEVTKTIGKDASEEAKEALAIRQANAAVMLLRMDAPDQVWPLLKQSPDPRGRTYIIHWLNPRGGRPEAIIARYQQESDVTIKRALLLCLGEFELVDAEKQSLIEMLLGVYRSEPDAGLHAAAEWLLRKWREGDKIAAIDKELQQTEELVAAQDSKRQWYINGQGQTFVILDADEFLMGSPDSEADRSMNERLHRRKIGRVFAISTKEVTHEQWRIFSQANPEVNWPSDQDQIIRLYIHTDDSPMLSMTWYEAVWYCNWLSEQEGIPEDQWCYEKNEGDKYGPGMKAKENFLELTGYRLPTEAEWACRAGASSSRYYGVTESLLTSYAWYQANGDTHTHPVASLKPNDFGLFDMQGNVYEWCYDAWGTYPSDTREAVIDLPSTGSVEDVVRRVFRGGGFNLDSEVVRSGCRIGFFPGTREGAGFRPARTYHLSP